jgi:alpha-N-acetylglucosamine transferase
MKDLVLETPARRYAYVTAITTDDYVPGVLALKVALKMAAARYPLISMVGEKVSPKTEKLIQSYGIETIRVPNVVIPDETCERNSSVKMNYWNNSFSKLAVMSLSEYEKLVYVDSDMLVIRNIDELFVLPHMSAVVAGKSYPGNEHWKDMNSGIMVIEPNENHYNDLIGCISAIEKSTNNKAYGDQEVFGYYYKWAERRELEISERYNVLAYYADYYVQNQKRILGSEKIKVIHFVGPVKPWARTPLSQLKQIVRLLISGKKYEAMFLIVYETIIYSIQMHVYTRKALSVFQKAS